MKQEEKSLLLKDLAQRLPYGIIIYRISDNSTHKFIHSDITENINMFSHFLEYSEYDEFKPYLRPMSDMTEEEVAEFGPITDELLERGTSEEIWNTVIDWLNAHYFDHRHLIEKGLALEAPEGMYKFND